MAMIDTAHKAPFGAVSIHRFVSGFYSVVESIRARNARLQAQEDLLKLSRAQLDDIGISLSDVIQEDPSPVMKVVIWFRNWRDNVATVRELSRLDARQLDDIGLTEGDVADYRRSAGLL